MKRGQASMLDFFSKKAKGGDSSNDNSEGSTETAQGPTILLEEATGCRTTESVQGPSSTISLKEATWSSTVTIQPLSESETVAKCRMQNMI
jgi:hypothetical protein